MRADTEIPGVTDVWVSDVRAIRARVTGQPLLRTRGGRDPILSVAVFVTCRIPSGEVSELTVMGTRPTAVFGSPCVSRRVRFEDVPPWLRDLIEEQAPS